MSTIAQNFRDFLSALIAEMKKDGRSEKRIPIQDGLRKESNALGTTYAFSWADPADLLFEGAGVRFQSGPIVMDATIALITADRLFVLLMRDLGNEIDTATIIIDQTSFLDALRRRMDDISTSRAVNFNITIANKVISEQGTDKLELNPEGATTLSEEQRRFVGLALSLPVVWLWGPPGTGKTWTLTALVDELYSRHERVLILSNTNKAVDQVLLTLCKRVGRNHAGIINGEFIRVGRISHPELESEWADAVSPEKIAERLSSKQRENIETLRSEQDVAEKEHDRLSETLEV